MMTGEQKDKLGQAAINAAKSLQERDKPIATAIERSHAAKWFKAGAQTILDNPREWGLCPKNDVAKERTKWIKELQERGLNHDKAMTDACGQIVDLERVHLASMP